MKRYFFPPPLGQPHRIFPDREPSFCSLFEIVTDVVLPVYSSTITATCVYLIYNLRALISCKYTRYPPFLRYLDLWCSCWPCVFLQAFWWSAKYSLYRIKTKNNTRKIDSPKSFLWLLLLPDRNGNEINRILFLIEKLPYQCPASPHQLMGQVFSIVFPSMSGKFARVPRYRLQFGLP